MVAASDSASSVSRGGEETDGDLWKMREEHEQSGEVQQVRSAWVQYMPQGCRKFLSLLHHRQA
jgi:hypothetical protein